MMSNSSAEEPPHDKKVMVETSPYFPLSSLPDELALSCLARVSPSDYRALSLVSKRYHSLLVSHELYKMRSLMGLTEKRHYVCLNKGHGSPYWCILRRERIKFRLIAIPSPPSDQYFDSSVVVLDWGIYVIGGWIKNKATSNVLLLDCRTHTWRKLPSMAIARRSPAAGVVDGKIYVFGGCLDIDSSNWAEVFDPKTQTWDTIVPMPDQNKRLELIKASLVMEEKVYALMEKRDEHGVQSKSLYYSPSEGKWGQKNLDSYRGIYNNGCVMIENLLYFWGYQKLFWCETEDFEWKEVKGLDSLPKSLLDYGTMSKLSNFGDNIVVFSRIGQLYEGTLEIRCTVISLERRIDGDEIWGKVEWSDALIEELALYDTVGQYIDFVDMVDHSVSVNL